MCVIAKLIADLRWMLIWVTGLRMEHAEDLRRLSLSRRMEHLDGT
jgi:hypothetical protein